MSAATNNSGSPLLRAAKVSSWILIALYLVAILLSARGSYGGTGPGTLFLILPIALALGVFYSPGHRGFAWCALVSNVAMVLLGLYEVGPAVFDVLGLSVSPSEKSALILFVVLLVIVLPCVLNSCALYLHCLTTRRGAPGDVPLERTSDAKQ